MNDKILNECIEINNKRDIHNEFITDGKFDIDKFKEQANWIAISCNQTLSEEFIREFQDKVNWYHISWKQKLSEDFIREFKDKVCWYHVSRGQKLSKEFIIKNLFCIYIDMLLKNEKIELDTEFIDNIKVLKKLMDGCVGWVY